MSKKSKLILATALFGAALFAASCGGGGGGGATAETGTGSGSRSGGGGGGGGGGTPSPTEQGRVLALLDVGTASAGTLNPVTICQLKSDNKAYCGNDLNPGANVDLEYVHEFPNGNVVLKGSDNKLYFFDGSQVKKLTTYRTLGGTSDINAPAGIDISSGTTYYKTEDGNFVIIYDGSSNITVITREGKVIKGSGISSADDINRTCNTVKSGSTYYKLNPDGSSSNVTATTPNEVLYRAGDKVLVKKDSKVYLSSNECSTSGAVEVVDIGSSTDYDAKMVKVGNDFYIAVRAGKSGTDLYYYRVSGNTPTPLKIDITLHAANKYYYALDGRGYLYAITAADTVKAYKPTDGTSAGNVTVTGVAGLLALADRVLAKSTTNAFEITTTGSMVIAVDKGTGPLHTALNRCTDVTNTKDFDGVGTNFVRCVYESGGSTTLYSLTYDSGTYKVASSDPVTGTFNKARWASNKVLVSVGSTVYLCNTTTTPSISCSSTDLSTLDLTNISRYLKVNGLDVFYTSSGVLKVGNVFDLPSALPITVSSASGGNASFDLNRFAFSFKPAVALCATQIVYLSSRTASPKTYTIAQPSNGCVKRILKVY